MTRLINIKTRLKSDMQTEIKNIFTKERIYNLQENLWERSANLVEPGEVSSLTDSHNWAISGVESLRLYWRAPTTKIKTF